MSHMVQLHPSQISWGQEILSWRKDGPVGLKNLGNTCYFNSVLQCLTYTPPLANICLDALHSSSCLSRTDRRIDCAFCFLEKRIRASHHSDSPVESPAKILESLQRSTKLFRVGRQEDAHELLRYAIEACNTACIRLQKPLAALNRQTKHGDGRTKEEPPTVVKDIFGGVVQSQVKCLACGTESNKLDEIMDLSLDIMPRLVSLREAMCRFFQPEVLDGDNKYHCSKCKKPTAARKQLSVFKAPNVLVIQLKRFENIYGGKIDRHVHFEERLGLVGHMCRSSKDARPEYSLYGVVVHAGHSQDGGHYYAHVKEPRGRWYCCNDASVYPVSPESVRAEKAYILFYVRNNSGPEVPPVVRNDSTPSPPTTPDTELQEPPKKYSSSLASVTHCKPDEAAAANSRLNPRKQMNSKKRNGSGPPEKAGGDDQFSKKHNTEGLLALPTLLSVPKEEICSSNGRRNGEDSSSPDLILPKQEGASNSNPASSLPRFRSDVITLPRVSSRDKLSDHRMQAGASVDEPNANSGLCESGVRENSSSTCVGARMTQADRESLVVAVSTSAGYSSNAFPEGMRHTGDKRHRDETQSSNAMVVDETSSMPVLETQSSMPRHMMKSDGDDWSGIGRFKLILEKETREELLGGGWCDDLRERLRAVKRRKKSEGLWPANATMQASLSRELFAEERETCKELIPKVLKERLVEHLRSYFCQKSAK